MKTFKHSGDLGDIVYSLPTVKALGGGCLYLDISGGVGDPACENQCIDRKTKFNRDGFNFLEPLLKIQPYISEVKIWNGEKVDYNLNDFRHKFNDPKSRSKTKNLVDIHLESFGLPVMDDNEAWITCDKSEPEREIIICRSPRYQSNFAWFQSNKFIFKEKAMFIGLEKEHELFEWTFGIKIPYTKVKDSLHMCSLIAGSKMFIANQTFSLSLAIGLGSVNIVQEVDPHVPNVVFQNKRNMQYV